MKQNHASTHRTSKYKRCTEVHFWRLKYVLLSFGGFRQWMTTPTIYPTEKKSALKSIYTYFCGVAKYGRYSFISFFLEEAPYQVIYKYAIYSILLYCLTE